MECPIGGPRCFEGCAKGNLALNYSPMSYTTERPSVPHNATLSPCHRPAFRRVVSGGTDARPDGVDGRGAHARRCCARGGHGAAAMVDERLRPFACSASMKGLSL